MYCHLTSLSATVGSLKVNWDEKSDARPLAKSNHESFGQVAGRGSTAASGVHRTGTICAIPQALSGGWRDIRKWVRGRLWGTSGDGNGKEGKRKSLEHKGPPKEKPHR